MHLRPHKINEKCLLVRSTHRLRRAGESTVVEVADSLVVTGPTCEQPCKINLIWPLNTKQRTKGVSGCSFTRPLRIKRHCFGIGGYTALRLARLHTQI